MTPRRLATLVLALALLAAACGDGGGGDDESGGASAAAACLSAGGHTGAVSDKGTADATGASITVDATDSAFSPTCTTNVTAATVQLTIKNSGSLLHNISLADQGIDEDVAAGESVTVSVEVGATPTVYECKYHRTSGMVGALAPPG